MNKDVSEYIAYNMLHIGSKVHANTHCWSPLRPKVWAKVNFLPKEILGKLKHMKEFFTFSIGHRGQHKIFF